MYFNPLITVTKTIVLEENNLALLITAGGATYATLHPLLFICAKVLFYERSAAANF